MMRILSLVALPFVMAGMKYTGVSESGLEFGYTIQGAGSGASTVIPTTSSVDFFINQNMNTFRLPFRWERVQPTLNGALNPTEIGHIDTFVTYATSKGAYVLLDVHNYAQYGGLVIGAGIPISDFANLWSLLAARYKSNPNVLFGLMNEPIGPTSASQSQTLTTETWVTACNAAITAIRNTGATNTITVPGLGYTGAHQWSNNGQACYYGTCNSLVMQNVVDPLNNLMFEVHEYLDSSTGFAGQATDCVTLANAIPLFSGVTTWARANNLKVFLGEFAGSSIAPCPSTMDGVLSYLEANQDVWLGFTYWSAGPGWGNYLFSLEQVGTSGVSNQPVELAAIANHLSGINTSASTTSTKTTTVASTSSTNTISTTKASSSTSTSSTKALTATTSTLVSTSTTSTTCKAVIAPGADCTATPNCCPSSSPVCYQKDAYFSGCFPVGGCTVGIHQTDPVAYQTNWSCLILGQSTSSPTTTAVVSTSSTTKSTLPTTTTIPTMTTSTALIKNKVNADANTNLSGNTLDVGGIAGVVGGIVFVALAVVTFFVVKARRTRFAYNNRDDNNDQSRV